MIVQTIVGAVLLLSGPCPDNPTTKGCAYYWQNPPVVYVSERLTPRRQQWVFEHELGHIALSRTPGAVTTNEVDAEWFATCHMPMNRSWMKYRRLWRGWTESKATLREQCAIREWN